MSCRSARDSRAPTAGLALALVASLTAPTLGAETPVLVACAPGFPGSTLEAQPSLDQFASALAAAAGLGRSGLGAVYYESEAPGVERLSRPDSAFLLTPLSFFLKHERALGLLPLAQAVAQGGAANEVWALFAGKGRLPAPSSLDGWEIVSLAGYAPGFVRGSALGSWGEVPAGARVVASGAVLSGLRRAASGEKVALLLDPAQAAAVSSLPFAGDLEVVARSAPMPAVVFCAVKGRGAAAQAGVLKALLGLHQTPGGSGALEAVRIQQFVALDSAALERARGAYRAAADPP